MASTSCGVVTSRSATIFEPRCAGGGSRFGVFGEGDLVRNEPQYPTKGYAFCQCFGNWKGNRARSFLPQVRGGGA